MTARTMIKFQFIPIVLVLLLIAAPLFAEQAALPSDKRVLIISIDGMRPDVLLRAAAPNIRALMNRGSFTFWAESTDLAITLPTHVSMLTGVAPARHRITWNDDRKVAAGTLKVPTLFELAGQAGYSSAMVVGKRKLCLIAKPGVLDCLAGSSRSGDNALTVAERAAGVLSKDRPQVMFVHFADPDNAGHAYGWGSPEQVASIDRVDQGVGMIMEALRQAGLQDRTLVILTADHGGSGRSHGTTVPYSRYIPWIAVGPGVRQNYDLTREAKPAVHVEDVFATALDFLGITAPVDINGTAQRSIYRK